MTLQKIHRQENVQRHLSEMETQLESHDRAERKSCSSINLEMMNFILLWRSYVTREIVWVSP